jgi:hypothetical protein
MIIFREIFWIKVLTFFDADGDQGIFLTLDPGSGINIPPDPQHGKDLALPLKCFFAVLHLSEVHDVNIMFLAVNGVIPQGFRPAGRAV